MSDDERDDRDDRGEDEEPTTNTATGKTEEDKDDQPITYMAVRVSAVGSGQPLFGVASCQVHARRFGVCEFAENELYTNFDSIVVQLNAKECYISADTPAPELRKIKGILANNNVGVKEIKASEFSTKDVEQDLTTLLGTIQNNFPEISMKNAISGVACFIKNLELIGDERNRGKWRLFTVDLARYMRLDTAASAALNLFPADGKGGVSLYGVLNKCLSKIGQRRLEQWLRQPLLDPVEIGKRQDIVQILMEATELRRSLQEDHLKRVPDIGRLKRRFLSGKANLMDTVNIYQTVVRLPGLVAALRQYEGEMTEIVESVLIAPLEKLMVDLKNLEALVENTIDLDLINQHEYKIKAGFDPELKVLSQQLNRVKKQIDNVHAEVIDDIGLKENKVKLEYNSQLGSYIRVSRKDEQAIRSNSKYISLEARKDGVKFTTKALKALSTEQVEANRKYERKQTDLVTKIIGVVASYEPVLESLHDYLATLDVYAAFAHVSANAPTPYVRPTLTASGTGDTVLTGARHPVLETQDGVLFIPNDVPLRRESSSLHVITGPNMGGKSTFIRMTGVITLMAQVGCFVPCTSASISIVDRILARVGAGDSQLRGVSTFMAEMLETSSILRTATANSLVIIDELGRGTSTYDGFGLAWGIAEHIVKEIGCFCLFATHFHELTALANEQPTVKNFHVTAHTTDTTLTLLYKVKQGPCDRSFGIHVAELANFPAEVVTFAKRKAAELEDFSTARKSEDDTVEPEAKRRKREEADGARLIRSFLAGVAAVPVEEMSIDSSLGRINELKRTLQAQENSYVAEVMTF